MPLLAGGRDSRVPASRRGESPSLPGGGTYTWFMIINVRAKQWARGWELHTEFGVTQSASLDTAERAVRDYVESLTDRDTSGDRVVIEQGQ